LGIELYDYKKDPLEKENLAEKPAYQQILNQHKHLVTTLLQTQNQSR
jgi:hypothetical protein